MAKGKAKMRRFGASALQRRLLGSASLLAAAAGYGRHAYAQASCYNTSGTNYICTGVGTSALSVNANNATVYSQSPLQVTLSGGPADALFISGAGSLSFIDAYADTIISGTDTGLGLRVTGDAGATPGSATILASGYFRGADEYAIYVYNSGSGDTSITLTGSARGGYGIYADNGTSAGNLSITVDGDIDTAREAIYSKNRGSGSHVITVSGAVESASLEGMEIRSGGNTTYTRLNLLAGGSITSNGANAVYARHNGSGDLILDLYGAITADSAGVYADNRGDAATRITVGGDITGGTGNSDIGVSARTRANTTGLSFTTLAGSDVSGGRYGAYLRHGGGGDLDATIGGTLDGGDNDGLRAATTNAASGAMSITTLAGSSVTGGGSGFGVSSVHFRTGDQTISAYGYVAGGYGAIQAINAGIGSSTRITVGGDIVSGDGPGAFANVSPFGVDLGVTTLAGSSITAGYAGANGGNFHNYYSGIAAFNYGSGSIAITADGTIDSGANGIFARQYSGGQNVSVTVGATGSVTGSYDGIYVDNYGYGATTVSVDGAVVGNGYDGVSAYNAASATDMTVTANGTVYGLYSGIRTVQYGGGATTVTVNGTVTGTRYYGVLAVNQAGTDLNIIAGGTTSGGHTGVIGVQYGTGAAAIAVNGEVTGGTYDAVFLTTIGGYAPTARITQYAGSTVTGGDDGLQIQHDGTGEARVASYGAIVAADDGIDIDNYGGGAATAIASGVITATDAGVYMLNAPGATDISLTVSGHVSGGQYGAYVNQYGMGDTSVQITGALNGTAEDGLYVYTAAGSGALTITAEAGSSLTAGDDAIEVIHNGTGPMSITVDGDIVNSDDGVEADNDGAGATSIAVGGTIQAADYGLDIDNGAGSSSLAITVSGAVAGDAGGILALQYGTGGATIAIQSGASVTSSGGTGLTMGGTSPFAVTLAGTLTGGGGTAAQFAGMDDTLTLNPGFAATGIVDGAAGTDALIFGGASGSQSFDMSRVGPASQFRNFETFAKAGDSTWTLTGTAGQGGTFAVNDGLLNVNGDLGAFDFTVAAGAKLGGNGTVGAVTSAGTVGAGNSIGTLNTGDFTSSGTLEVEIDGTGAADLINVTGTVDIAGSTLDLQTLGTGGHSTIRTLATVIANDGTDAVAGTFAAGTGLNTAGTLYSVADTAGGGGNDVTLDIYRTVLSLADGTDVSETVTFPDGFPGLTFVVAGGASATFSGALSDSATPVGAAKAGTGTLTVSGALNLDGEFSLDEGALGLAADGALGGMDLIAAGGTTVDYADGVSIGNAVTLNGPVNFNQSGGAATQAGAISGAGSMIKTGGGTLTVSGANSFTGGTTIQQGQLTLNGSMASGVTVGADATLAGTGSAAGLTVAGEVSPGNSIGTLTVAGDLAFQPGSSFTVEADASGAADLIAASGAAQLNGGTAALVPLSSDIVYEDGLTYTILTADGGVAGAFEGTTDPSFFLSGSLEYDPNAVRLVIRRDGAPTFAGAAATFNQRQAASGLQGLTQSGDALATFNSVLFLQSESEAQAAFDLASGEAHATWQQGAQAASDLFAETVSRHAGFGMRDVPVLQSRGAIWGGVMAESGVLSTDVNAARMNDAHYGVAGGADMGAYLADGEVTGGVAFGYTDGEADIDARLSGAEIETVHAGLYAAWDNGTARLSGALNFAAHDVETTRRIAWSGLSRTATAEREGQTWGGSLEGAWRIKIGEGLPIIAPLATLDYARTRLGAAAETGAGALNAHVAPGDYEKLDSGLGLAASDTISIRGTDVGLDVRALWRHSFGDNTASQAVTLQGAAGAPFLVLGPDNADDWAEVGVGFHADLTESVTLGARIDAAIASEAMSHKASVSLGWRF